jgi:hypothetical protein
MAVRPEPFEGTDPARRASARRREPQGEGHPGGGSRQRGEKPVLCLTCKRVRPALSPAEYTVLRAYSITLYGLCTCARPDGWQPMETAGLTGPGGGTCETGR